MFSIFMRFLPFTPFSQVRYLLHTVHCRSACLVYIGTTLNLLPSECQNTFVKRKRKENNIQTVLTEFSYFSFFCNTRFMKMYRSTFVGFKIMLSSQLNMSKGRSTASQRELMLMIFNLRNLERVKLNLILTNIITFCVNKVITI